MPHRRRLAQHIYRRLFGLTVPIDVIVVTPEDVERYHDKVGPIIGPALGLRRTRSNWVWELEELG